MILNHDQIIRRVRQGNIEMPNFKEERVGPNSYDVTLNSELMVYMFAELDCRAFNPTCSFNMPEEGFVIEPGRVYIGGINETILNHCSDLVPMLEGRSSVARLGVGIHVCAGFGDIGFSGRWTLEITAVQPTRIYPNMPIGQIYWITTEDCSEWRYRGKYVADVAQASRLHEEFDKLANREI